VQIIEELGAAMGLAVVGNHAVLGGGQQMLVSASMHSCSYSYSATTTHEIELCSAKQADSSGFVMSAAGFTRCIQGIVWLVFHPNQEAGEGLEKYAHNDERPDDRKLVITQLNDGRLEQSLQIVRDKIMDPARADVMLGLKNLLMLSQVIEDAFSQGNEIATKILPRFTISKDGEPVFGMILQTNHPQLARTLGQLDCLEMCFEKFSKLDENNTHRDYQGSSFKGSGAEALNATLNAIASLAEAKGAKLDIPSDQLVLA
jgi:hypothetical protein